MHVKANGSHNSVGNIPYGKRVPPLFKGLIIQIKLISNSKCLQRCVTYWLISKLQWYELVKIRFGTLCLVNHISVIIGNESFPHPTMSYFLLMTDDQYNREVDKSPRNMCQIPLRLKNIWGYSPVDIHSFVLCHLGDRRIPLCQQRGTNKADWSFLCFVYWPK